jgi:hypothetical protein
MISFWCEGHRSLGYDPQKARHGILLHILTQHMNGGIIYMCANFYGTHVECAFTILQYTIFMKLSFCIHQFHHHILPFCLIMITMLLGDTKQISFSPQ